MRTAIRARSASVRSTNWNHPDSKRRMSYASAFALAIFPSM